MAETRVNTGVTGKVTTSHSNEEPRHILSSESDALAKRIAELVGDKKVSWFAKECGFGESLLRKYLTGAQPNTSNLVAMANTGNVTVDWLATGRLPKTRAELRAATQQSQGSQATGSAQLFDTYRLAVEVVQEWQVENGKLLPLEKFARAIDLLVDLSDGEPAQVKKHSAKVLRLAA